MYPGVNCEINKVTSKFQMDFFGKTYRKKAKTENLSIIIKVYIFEILYN